MTSPSVEEFIVAAREFCSLAEQAEPLGEQDLPRIRELLLRLIFHVPAVERAPQECDFHGARQDHRQYVKAIQHFARLGFNSYRAVFDPHDFDAEDESVIGQLSDDLADIYGDLAEGLSNLDNGHLPDACFDWALSYRSHWARHAVNALAAIEIKRTDEWEDVERDRLWSGPDSPDAE